MELCDGHAPQLRHPQGYISTLPSASSLLAMGIVHFIMVTTIIRMIVATIAGFKDRALY